MIWIILVVYLLIGLIFGSHENYQNQPHDDEVVYLVLYPAIWPLVLLIFFGLSIGEQTNKFWRWIYTKKGQ